MIGNRLERYIGANVLLAILVVMFIIITLASLFAFIDQLNDFKNNYGSIAALKYVALTAPRRLYDTLPMAALVGSLIGLGAMASNSELTIMRAAGMSTGQIAFAVLRPVLIIMVASVLLGEFVIPGAELKAQAGKELATSYNGIITSSSNGLWHRQGNEYIHIGSVQPTGHLLNVTRYHKENQQIQYASYSQKASLENNQWILENTQTTYFDPDKTRLEKTDKEPWNVDLKLDLLKTITTSPDNLPITGLWQYINYLEQQELNNENYWLALWGKILQPIETLALVLLAISFIFGPLRSVSMGQRIFTGVVIGFVFRIAQSLLGPASLVFHFPPLLAVATPIIVCILTGLYLLKRKC